MGCLKLERLEQEWTPMKVIHKAESTPKNSGVNYYPFGLAYEKIQKTALKNRYQYNGIEHVDDFGLGWNMTLYRPMDSEIGRFTGIDPKAEHDFSGSAYSFGYNSPITFNDPMGDCPVCPLILPAIAKAASVIGPVATITAAATTTAAISATAVAATATSVAASAAIGSQLLPSSVSMASNSISGYSSSQVPSDIYGDMQSFPNYTNYSSQGVIPEFTVTPYGNDIAAPQFAGRFGGWQSTGTGVGLSVSENYINSGYTDALGKAAFIGIGGALVFGAGLPAALGGVGTGGTIGASSQTGRVFWSGGRPAMNAAAEFAKSNGLRTLEMTTRGRIMNTLNPLMPRSISNPIWRNLSSNFAKGAKGTANFFTTKIGPRTTSIWNTVEKPILKKNFVRIITHIVK